MLQSLTRVRSSAFSLTKDLKAHYSVGIYYESGKEPPSDGPPKLHLLIESNEEWRVSTLLRESDYERDADSILGRARRAGDQATARRSVHRRLASRDAQYNRYHWSLQRCLNAQNVLLLS